MAGFVAKVDLFPGQKKPFILVPIEALVDSEGNQAYVFVPEGETAKKKKIEIAHIFGERAAIGKGLEGVESVITDGAAYLHDGAAIRVIR